jgi:diacylglycerol O-acyltransferase
MVRKKIAFADHAWLRMDDPTNWMVITGLMTFDAPLDFERFKGVIENCLLGRFKRFHQRLVPSLFPFTRPTWEDDPNFSLEAHIERVQLSQPADQKALQDLINVLMSTELDYSRPLWHFYIVENYGSGGAFIARLHHCMADGISLVQVLLSLTELAPPSSDTQQTPAATKPGMPSSILPAKTRKSEALITDHWGLRDFWQEGVLFLSDPEYARHRVHQGIDLAEAIGKLALRWPDPETIFKGPLGIEKRAAWSEPLDLKEVKFIRNALNATVNDVLISAVTGALRRYIDLRGKTADDLNIRSIVPVNLRPIELDEELGNKFGLVFLKLPLSIDDPLERLQKIRQNMEELKSSPEALATYGILNVIGGLPIEIEDLAVAFFDTKATAVVTNVPGPAVQLYLAGVPINTVMAWVPQSGRISLGVSIVSYNGKVWLGIATDKDLVPDPETIVTFFHTEFDELMSRAQNMRAERQSDLQSMLSLLDDALQKLDDVLTAKQTQSTPRPDTSPPAGQ